MASVHPVDTALGRQGKAWRMCWSDDAGRRHQKIISGVGRREADRRANELEAMAKRGLSENAGKLPVAAYLQEWLRLRTGLAPQSVLAYTAAVAYWSGALGTLQLSRLRPLRVQQEVRAMLDAGVAPNTARKRVVVLKAALKQAVEWGLLATLPVAGVKIPSAPPVARALTAEQAMALLAAAREHPCGLQVILALGLGLRFGEVLALTWEDVSLTEGVAHVRRSLQAKGREMKTPKSGRSRDIRCPEFVLIALREAWAKEQALRAKLGDYYNPLGLVCLGKRGGGPAVRSTSLMAELCEKAGIPQVRFHDLRHTSASLAIQDGADVAAVSRRLGHASILITMGVYYHPTSSADEEIVDKLDRKLGG